MSAESYERDTGNSAAIISSEDEIMHSMKLIFDVETSLDICVDMKNPLSSIDLRLFKLLAFEAARTGKPIRMITEIDTYNIDYCKSLFQYDNIKIRHLGEISGLMIVGRLMFLGTVAFDELTTARQLVTSSSSKVLQYQKKNFTELWDIAVPAPVRIEAVETGSTEGKHELIQNPASVEDAYLNAVESARSQILLMMTSTKAFDRQHSMGITSILKRAISRGVQVRMLLPAGVRMRQEMADFAGAKNASVHFIDADLNSKSTIAVIDRRLSLVIEIKDDSQDVFSKAIGHATVSTVKSTVQSYTSLFDNYWHHAESYEKLQRADRLKDEFINIAAHELRTPIMPIVGIVEVLMSQLNDPSQQSLRNDIEIIYRNADRLKRLAEDILNVSRIESGNFKLEIAECDIYSVIGETIQEIRGSFGYWSRKRQLTATKQLSARRGAQSVSNVTDQAEQSASAGSLYTMIMDIIGEVEPERSISADGMIVFSRNKGSAKSDSDNDLLPEGLWLRCDPKKVKQALYNLLSNALKFTDFSGGGKIFVNAAITEDGEQMKISVKDRGEGIDASIIDRLFERFATKSESGTGLGLYITKRIVEAHGGIITAENNIDGRGATFSFTLPLSPFSTLSYERTEGFDRVTLLEKEIEERRGSLNRMRTDALHKISDMKLKLMDARDRAMKARDTAIEEYQKKVEASRGLLRVRQELLSEQINYNSMRRDIDRRVERGLEGLSTVIENLKGDLAGDETLDKVVLSPSYANHVSVEAERIIHSDFFKSLQMQLKHEERVAGNKNGREAKPGGST